MKSRDWFIGSAVVGVQAVVALAVMVYGCAVSNPVVATTGFLMSGFALALYDWFVRCGLAARFREVCEELDRLKDTEVAP